MNEALEGAHLTEAEQQSLGRVLMQDHGCIHHQGPNPFLNPCRACMRRVDLIDGWLAARAAAPVEAGLAEALAALADECANSGCIHLNDMYGKLRALLRPAPAADGGAES